MFRILVYVSLFYLPTAQAQFLSDATEQIVISGENPLAVTTFGNETVYISVNSGDSIIDIFGDIDDGPQNNNSFIIDDGLIRDIEGSFAAVDTVSAFRGSRFNLESGESFTPVGALSFDGFSEVSVGPVYAVDSSGGMGYFSGGVNSAYFCPGMNRGIAVPEAFGATFLGRISLPVAIDCNMGVALSLLFSDDSYEFFFSDLQGPAVAEPNLLPFSVAFDPTATVALPLPQATGEIATTDLDPNGFTAFMQGFSAGDVCYVYTSSNQQTLPMQFGDTCLALVEDGVVFSDAADQTVLLNGLGDRVLLTVQGAPYTGAVDAIINSNGELDVVSAGSTLSTRHVRLAQPPETTEENTDDDIFGDQDDPTAQDPSCPDSDGDGFGWDGTATCFPFGIDPLADQPEPDLSHIVVDGPLQCIDTDGDGFGWNGTQTCTPPTPIDEVRDIVCIDTDGDGFGWTGSASCVVEADGSITIL